MNDSCQTYKRPQWKAFNSQPGVFWISFCIFLLEMNVRMNICVIYVFLSVASIGIFVIKSNMYAHVFIYIYHDAARLCTILLALFCVRICKPYTCIRI